MTTQESISVKTTKDKEKSHATIEGVIPKEKIKSVYGEVIKRLGKEKKINGFREGSAPPEVIEKEVGSIEVWRQSAQEVVIQSFPEIVAKEEVVPLGSPEMQITKIADKGDVSFKMSFYTMPEINLPEYRPLIQQLEKPAEPEEATDEEVQQVITDVRKDLYKRAHPEKDFPKDEKDLPTLTDAYIKEISKKYNDIESFKKGVRESITHEKALQERAKFRQKILDTVVEGTTVILPEIIVEEESKRARKEMEERAKQFGTTVEEYLKAQNMTEEKLQEDIKTDAKKRAKTQLILNAISAKESIHASKDEVEKEVKRFKERETGMDERQLNTYIETLLTNEAVIQSLENMVKDEKQEAEKQENK